MLLLLFVLSFVVVFSPPFSLREIGSLWLGKAQQPQEQRYPFLSVCAVFSCVQTMVRLPKFGIVHVRTDVDACDRTRGLYGYSKRVCTES